MDLIGAARAGNIVKVAQLLMAGANPNLADTVRFGVIAYCVKS
jgi:hypothetical protein